MKIKKLILMWLFGTDDIKSYMELLRRGIDHCEERIELINSHKETLKREERELEMVRTLLKVCKDHGIEEV